MKWKNGLMMAVMIVLIALLVVVLILLARSAVEPQSAKDMRVIKSRIKELKVVLEEQKLITEILQLRYDAAVIRAKFAPAQPEPAPQPALPPQIKE